MFTIVFDISSSLSIRKEWCISTWRILKHRKSLPGNAQIDHKRSFLLSHSHYNSLKESIIFISPPSSMKSVSTEPEYLPWENKTTKTKKILQNILESKGQKTTIMFAVITSKLCWKLIASVGFWKNNHMSYYIKI